MKLAAPATPRAYEIVFSDSFSHLRRIDLQSDRVWPLFSSSMIMYFLVHCAHRISLLGCVITAVLLFVQSSSTPHWSANSDTISTGMQPRRQASCTVPAQPACGTSDVQNAVSDWFGYIYQCRDTDEAKEKFASAAVYFAEHLQCSDADACVALISWIMLGRPDTESVRFSVWRRTQGLSHWPDWLLEAARSAVGIDSMDDAALFDAIASNPSASLKLSSWASQYLEIANREDPTLVIRAYRIALEGGLRDARWDSVLREVAGGQWGDDRTLAFEIMCNHSIPLSGVADP